MLAAFVVRVSGSSLPVHLGFLVAAGTLLAVGAWLERFIFRIDSRETPAPAHQIALGQVALLVYFYARSALGHGLHVPGVRPWELYALGGAATLHLLFRRTGSREGRATRTAAYASVWLAWWASCFTFLGYRSGRLETPSSDPDMHAIYARLTAEHGRLIYDLQPQNALHVSYPSAFSALDALWIQLSGASAVSVVNCQVALQACLAVGLVVEMVFALRRGPALVTALLLVGLAHRVFSFPVDAFTAYLEGTPRLAHKALAILPLTFVIRLSCSEVSRRAPLGPTVALGSFCVACAIALNPAHLFVEIPIALVALLLLVREARRRTGSSGALLRWSAGSIAIVSLLLFSDAWSGPMIRGVSQQAGSLPGGPLQWRVAVHAALARIGTVSWVHAFPYSCIGSSQCPPLARALGGRVVLPLVLLAVALIVGARWVPAMRACRVAALVVVGIAACLWATSFLADFVPTLLSAVPGQNAELLGGYSRLGLIGSTALLFFALLGAALSLGADVLMAAVAPLRRVSMAVAAELIPPAALAVACVAITAHDPAMRRATQDAYSRNVENAPLTSMGPILPEDLRLARAAAKTMGADEKILLPGVVKQMNDFEVWFLTLGGARSIPLYTDVPFAFFHGVGASAADYRDHVCDRLDLPWLASRGIVWLYESRSVAGATCVHGWPEARDRYFELKVSDATASLWRLRTDLLEQAKRDPLLAR